MRREVVSLDKVRASKLMGGIYNEKTPYGNIPVNLETDKGIKIKTNLYEVPDNLVLKYQFELKKEFTKTVEEDCLGIKEGTIADIHFDIMSLSREYENRGEDLGITVEAKVIGKISSLEEGVQ